MPAANWTPPSALHLPHVLPPIFLHSLGLRMLPHPLLTQPCCLPFTVPGYGEYRHTRTIFHDLGGCLGLTKWTLERRNGIDIEKYTTFILFLHFDLFKERDFLTLPLTYTRLKSETIENKRNSNQARATLGRRVTGIVSNAKLAQVYISNRIC
jgi:hypothetical protein